MAEDKFGPNGMETRMNKFDLRASQREPNASAVSLGSLAPENMRPVQRNWQQLAENERPQSLPLRQFNKGLMGTINFGQVAWKQTCTNLLSEHFKGNQMLLQLA